MRLFSPSEPDSGGEIKSHTYMDVGCGSQPGGQVVHVDDRAFDFGGIFPELWVEILSKLFDQASLRLSSRWMIYPPIKENDLISSLDFVLQQRFNLGQVAFTDKFSVAKAGCLGRVLSIHEAVRVEREIFGMAPDIVDGEAYFFEHQIRVPLIFRIFGDVDKDLERPLFLI